VIFEHFEIKSNNGKIKKEPTTKERNPSKSTQIWETASKGEGEACCILQRFFF
jgi:hypothetical protein